MHLRATAKAKDASDKFDRTQWKSMQQTMTDSIKFVDMLHNVSWEDGLPSDVMTGTTILLSKWHSQVRR